MQISGNCEARNSKIYHNGGHKSFFLGEFVYFVFKTENTAMETCWLVCKHAEDRQTYQELV